MKIGIVAGGAAGDILAADLVAKLKAHYPSASFEGVAGPYMMAQGVRPLYPMERLSVTGVANTLRRIKELYSAREKIAQYFINTRPDIYIGIDFPLFNLGIERKLKEHGIKTVHYVSPTVWAWWRSRIKHIGKCVDLMLCQFPFEPPFYQQQNVAARFVGHPLADIIPMDNDMAAARKELKLQKEGPVIAMLPGSRISEVEHLSEVFIQAAQWCVERQNGIQFVVPLYSQRCRKHFEEVLSRQDEMPPIRLVDGKSRMVMCASDIVLTACGTATLEALLLKKPMVVAYKLANPVYILYRFLSQVRFYSLPNLLAGSQIVPEILQERVTPENLGLAMLNCLETNGDSKAMLLQQFSQIHENLKQNANEQAVNAILELVQ